MESRWTGQVKHNREAKNDGKTWKCFIHSQNSSTLFKIMFLHNPALAIISVWACVCQLLERAISGTGGRTGGLQCFNSPCWTARPSLFFRYQGTWVCERFPLVICVFLAVQGSSIVDLVSQSLSESVSRLTFDFSVFRALQSCCRQMWPFWQRRRQRQWERFSDFVT